MFKKFDSHLVPFFLVGTVIFMFGLTYASVPLYQLFCRVSGFGYVPVSSVTSPSYHVSSPLTINLLASTDGFLDWDIQPRFQKLTVFPGDTALAFFLVHNVSDFPSTGFSTYHVTPSKAGVYLNKIQCFCFQEQRLKGSETVELPILFFLDSDLVDDPKMQDIDGSITLSYTFCLSRDS